VHEAALKRNSLPDWRVCLSGSTRQVSRCNLPCGLSCSSMPRPGRCSPKGAQTSQTLWRPPSGSIEYSLRWKPSTAQTCMRRPSGPRSGSMIRRSPPSWSAATVASHRRPCTGWEQCHLWTGRSRERPAMIASVGSIPRQSDHGVYGVVIIRAQSSRPGSAAILTALSGRHCWPSGRAGNARPSSGAGRG
jgi:hypothetical protein